MGILRLRRLRSGLCQGGRTTKPYNLGGYYAYLGTYKDQALQSIPFHTAH